MPGSLLHCPVSIPSARLALAALALLHPSPGVLAQGAQGMLLQLKPSEQQVLARTPLACEWRLEGEPAAKAANPVQARLRDLLAGRFRFKGEGKLEIDERGGGAVWKPVANDKPARVELVVDGVRWPLVLWRKHELWHATSGAVQQATIEGRSLQSLDADLDGLHLGENDWLRLEDTAWHPCGSDPLVQVGSRLVGLKNFGDHKSVKFSGVIVPAPSGVHTGTMDGLAAFNRERMIVGQAPMRIDLATTLSLQKHALYVATAGNDGDLLAEKPGQPGYTAEGDEAARTTQVLAPVDAVVAAIGPTFRSAYNRANFLADPSPGFAAACMTNRQPERHGGRVGYTWVQAGRQIGLQFGVPRVVPAPGQESVPCFAESEWPISEERPELFATTRGTAIAAYFGKAPWTKASLVVLDRNGKIVKGECFHPDRPAAPSRGADNQGAVFFWPTAPLQPRSRYEVELRATVVTPDGDEPVALWWSFTTSK